MGVGRKPCARLLLKLMRIAVMTLTRDRLEYTQHCFAALHENAGCQYDHFVLDQGSEDGTQEWLRNNAGRFEWVTLLDENIGISRGMNQLLDEADGYDVYVTFDNDCEVTQLGTLAACAKIAARGDWIVSPVVNGLLHPPAPYDLSIVDNEPIGLFRDIGGIFRVMPGAFAESFRFDEANPIWGRDEVDVGMHAAYRGIGVGYMLDWSVNHYQTTAGQQAMYPAYFQRKAREYA